MLIPLPWLWDAMTGDDPLRVAIGISLGASFVSFLMLSEIIGDKR